MTSQTSYAGGRLPEVNSMYFPATLLTLRCKLASVLDLEQYHLLRSGHILQAEHSAPSGLSHTRGDQTILMLISLNDVNFVRS